MSRVGILILVVSTLLAIYLFCLGDYLPAILWAMIAILTLGLLWFER